MSIDQKYNRRYSIYCQMSTILIQNNLDLVRMHGRAADEICDQAGIMIRDGLNYKILSLMSMEKYNALCYTLSVRRKK